MKMLKAIYDQDGYSGDAQDTIVNSQQPQVGGQWIWEVI
jgi:hypothetical protein